MFKTENIQGLLEPEIIPKIFIKNSSLRFLNFPIISFTQNTSWPIYDILMIITLTL